MAPLYREALIIGATSGIGEAFAAKLHSEGTAVDRDGAGGATASTLSSLHIRGSSAAVIDIARLDSNPGFCGGAGERGRI
ncbi:hypothetical protein M434DRAFT_38952 [Hypoxylon sp. CO27-5]|nr:hypothetical protein M434DRAFT_38952 [Hypoxylon sp. CO27-5]